MAKSAANAASKGNGHVNSNTGDGVRMTSARNPWWTVVGSVLGLSVSTGPVMQFSFGVFLKPLADEFGSDRGTISAGLLIALCLNGLATPIVGRLIDRFGTRAVALPAIALFAVGIAALGLVAHGVVQFIVLYGLLGIVAAGQAPLPYARAVAGVFEERRGLALGVSMAGVGIGTALLPQLAQALISEFGWRVAYVLLAIVAFLLAFPAMAFLVGGSPRVTQAHSDLVPGMRASEAWRTPTFWLLVIPFLCVSLATSGVIAHIIPLLTDVGVPPRVAATALGIVGVALIAGRLLAGYLLDRVYAPYVALVFFMAPVAGIALLLLSSSVTVTLAAVLLVGLGLGAEVDLIAYLISRYFGMRAFGEIYGYMFAMFMLGSGVGPFVMGVTFQQTGGYAPALLCFAAALVLACVLISRLGAYAFGVRPLPVIATISA